MEVNEEGEIVNKKPEKLPEELEMLKKYLLDNYEPVKEPGGDTLHFTTNELYSQLYNFIPCHYFSPQMLSTWLTGGGFSFYDFGEIRLEWIMKKKN